MLINFALLRMRMEGLEAKTNGVGSILGEKYEDFSRL
jgi:hypothetical protein